jgi:uncharacterized protein (TIGR04255 family)
VPINTPEYFAKYENPPVVEVVCGVVFEPINAISTAFFGLLWNEYGEDFPTTRDLPPLEQPHRADVSGQYLQIDLQQAIMPTLPRVWFVSEDESRIIQVQRDRFHFNWRKIKQEEAYPRFPDVYRGFSDKLEKFKNFIHRTNEVDIIPAQYELTYVNHILLGEDAIDFGGVQCAFPDLAWRNDPNRFLPNPVGVQWDAKFPVPEVGGILQVKVRSARSKNTGEPLFLLDFAVRGSAEILPMDDWFQLARKWIVKGFADIIDEDMQKNIFKFKRKGGA